MTLSKETRNKTNIIMRKLIGFVAIAILFAACSSSGDEAIKKQIIMKKQQIANIEQQITDLQKQLSDTVVKENLVPVAVKEMKPEPFNHYFVVFGNVEADKYGNISPEMGGKVEKIHVQEGQEVKKGALLVTLNTDAIANQISGVKTNLEFAEKTFNKQKALWDQEIGSEIQYLQAKSAKEGLEAQLKALNAQMRMSQIRAPYSGIVNKIYPKKGEMAGPSFPVIEFVNLSNITVKAAVSEKYISKVNKGDLVHLTFSSLNDFKMDIPVDRVSKVINPKSRTFEIVLKLNNVNDIIKPNMVSSIRINDFSVDEALVVPSLIIKKDISGDYVYVAVKKDGKTTVEKRAVQIGMSYKDQSMITDGLSAGDNVIVKGYSLVSTGIPVSIK